MTDIVRSRVVLPMEAFHTFCDKWSVCELALFGSILREDFHPQSDIDVLVQFRDDAHPTLFDLVRMTNELESLLGRKVDLLTRKSVEEDPNYIRRNAILGSAQVIYAK